MVSLEPMRERRRPGMAMAAVMGRQHTSINALTTVPAMASPMPPMAPRDLLIFTMAMMPRMSPTG